MTSAQQPRLFESQIDGENEPVECLGLVFANDADRRTYFTELLREKLQDPEFRKIEGFPIGEDEDILALSDPPYYTACPNPFIEDFLRFKGKSNEATSDDYHREPFAADTKAGKFDPIYRSHSYHTKVPYLAIQEYLAHYTVPGDIVLDFFAGTGMTGVAARRMEDGARHAILVDLSPEATFIASAMTRIHNFERVKLEHKRVSRELVKQTESIYSGLLDQPGGRINYTVWSDVFICPQCSEDLVFWNVAVKASSGKIRSSIICPRCNIKLKKTELIRKQQALLDPMTGEHSSQTKSIPVLLDISTKSSRFQRPPTSDEINRILSVNPYHYSAAYPTDEMLFKGSGWGDSWRAGYHVGFSRVHHFYERRSLAALAALYSLILDSEQRSSLTFMFSGMLPRASKLHKWKKGQTTGTTTGTLYVPSLRYEYNINKMWRERISYAGPVLSADDSREHMVSTQSSTHLINLPSDSVQYLFVDPPFGDNLMYSELNFIWESWLRVFTQRKPEAIVSSSQNKTIQDYLALMKSSLSEAYRILQPGRWMTLVFHNSKNTVWAAIQEAILSAGFVIADVRTLDKKQSSFKQVNAAGAVKQDLIISAYKPNRHLEERFKLDAGSEEGVWDFVRGHLRQLPVFVSKDDQAEIVVERQDYLLFDRMIAFHVQRGVTVPLSAAEFYQGLGRRFAERDGMFFLPEQVVEYDRRRLSAKEVIQLEIFVSNEESAIQWIRQQLTVRPQTFQDLQPRYMQETKGGWQKNEILLELRELLEQNFLHYDGLGKVPSQIHSYLSSNYKDMRKLPKDDPALQAMAKDRWYVPDPNKQADLEKLREKGLLREFDSYRDSKQRRLKVFRLEAVRAGFKRAWQEGDYETIIEVARKIPDNVMQEDPKLLMWYDVALTRTGQLE